MLTLTPINLKTANAFVQQYHRHHKPTRGHKFSIGVSENGALVGVAICGRPVARRLDDGYTLEVNRLCTDGTPNACSILYAAAYRAARAMGYNRVVTYILDTENGASLKAAGYTCEGRAGGLEWNGAKAPKQADQYPRQMKTRWVKKKEGLHTPKETLSFYVAECLEFTFAGEFHDHLTMEEALEAYDKIPSERMNADKCIGFCIEEDGGFVGMYELVVNDKVQRENINSINYFRDDRLVQQAISDMEKLMTARQQSKEQERSNTKKSVLDALRSLKAKKQEQPAQEQDKPKKAKTKGMEL